LRIMQSTAQEGNIRILRISPNGNKPGNEKISSESDR
jgi:hypothetical protein